MDFPLPVVIAAIMILAGAAVTVFISIGIIRQNRRDRSSLD